MGKPDRATLKKEGEALKSIIAEARKKTLNFAISQGKDSLVIETHLKKNPEILRKMARQNGGGPKGMHGQLHADGKTLVFSVDEEPPGVFTKLIRTHFLQRGQTINVEIRLPGESQGSDAAAPDEAPQDDAVPESAAPDGDDGNDEPTSNAPSDDWDEPRRGGVYDDYPLGSAEQPGTPEWDRVQAEAETDFAPLRADFAAKVEAARKAAQPSTPIRDAIASCAGHLSKADSAAKAGHFVQARDILRVKNKDLTALQTLLDDQDRANWLSLSAEQLVLLLKRVPACLNDFKVEYESLIQLHQTSIATAETGNYAKALEQLHALGAELDALDIKISDLAKRNEVFAAIEALEPGLTAAKIVAPGEEGYESLSYLRANIAEYEAEAYRLAHAFRFDEAMAQTSYLGTDIRELEHAIVAKEAAEHTPSEMPPGPLSFDALAAEYKVSAEVLWAINPDLQNLRGSPDKVMPGDPILLPDPELNIEIFEFSDKVLIIPRKKRLELERLLATRVGQKVEAKLASRQRTYEAIWETTSKGNVGFVGSVVCIFARTDNSAVNAEFYAARDAQTEFRNAVKAEKLAPLDRLATLYEVKVRAFGRAVYEWREKLYGGARRAISTIEFVRDATFMVAGTLAAGPIVATARLGIGGSMVVNGLSNSAFGVLRKLDDAAIEHLSGEDVDWAEFTESAIKGAAFDFMVGGAADGLTKTVGFALTGKLSGALSSGGPISNLPFGGSLSELFKSSLKAEAKASSDDLVNLFSTWILSDGHKSVVPAIKKYWSETAVQTLNQPLNSPVTEDELSNIMADVILRSMPEIGDSIVQDFEKSPDYQMLLREN